MGDSYRPPPRPKREQRPPPAASLAGRVTFNSGGGGENYVDSYRPGAPPSDRASGAQFTFSSQHTAPRFPPAPPADSARRRRHVPGVGFRKNGARRDQQRPFPHQKPAPHERALLRARTGTSPERPLGVTQGCNRFRDLDELSSSETSMSIDDDENRSTDSDEADQPKKKVPRVPTSASDGNAPPRWSNPDPYTVLPPPETTGKKKDFVQLIRKAKIQAAEKTKVENAVTANEDFISFGDDEDKPKEAAASKGAYSMAGSLNDITANWTSMAIPRDSRQHAGIAGLPARPPLPARPKRKRDESIGDVLPEWQTRTSSNPAPWCKNKDYASKLLSKGVSDYDRMLMLLHNEILDFGDYVLPGGHEHNVRMEMVGRIERCVAGRGAVFPGSCRIKCFGSFPTHMYLPTADMDLVLVSDQHFHGGPKIFDVERRRQVSSVLYTAERLLRRSRIATATQVIAKAKVPIIKFVDVATGIKVDLSMENLTGVAAQQTFKQWKDKESDLATLVVLVKQFLFMRGLNDVHTGGLGGFSITCLVYAFLRTARSREESEGIVNLGKLFMGFLDFWGNQFQLATQRLVMHTDPPTIVPKDTIGVDGREERPDRLSIQDPNNPENNVSGGSNRVEHIFRLFSEAHKVLEQRLRIVDLSGVSILETIIGGNYDSYEQQWRRIGRR
ncbi:uncharacterized protein EI97DRAFT_451909 [Westerdykella ornata]|uniref:polynucleotide adenylyltransferase n=1 Tax=Westerdykella ornata TaxID=318751 RepID=A0A6A6JCV8_WESOR|nr:uncharacterized protein EI97DRAFT_451909 [Westerdykella ornata]KAF2274105.1 hypothetical protein EI97DRAFT_451909 [Westerdykella ornata]